MLDLPPPPRMPVTTQILLHFQVWKSQPKPSFARGRLDGGGNPKYLFKFIYMYICYITNYNSLNQSVDFEVGGVINLLWSCNHSRSQRCFFTPLTKRSKGSWTTQWWKSKNSWHSPDSNHQSSPWAKCGSCWRLPNDCPHTSPEMFHVFPLWFLPIKFNVAPRPRATFST